MRVKRLDLAKGRSAADLAAEIRALTPPPEDVREAVAEIVEDVRARCDKALREWTERFDGAAPRRVTERELRDALESLDQPVRAGLETAIENVRRVAEAELREPIGVDLPEGQQVELRELPVRRAGIYAPGGRAAYPSTVVMCSVPARTAGVDQLVVVTPGSDVIVAACALCGVDEVHLMGGAQAIAALAHGTLLIFFGLQHTVVGAMVFVGLTSLAVMVYLGMANTLMQTRAPDSLRGRVMSVQTMVFIGFMPLGQMVLGSVGTLVGINNAFLVGGVIVALLAGYAALRVTALRQAVATARPRPATTS